MNMKIILIAAQEVVLFAMHHPDSPFVAISGSESYVWMKMWKCFRTCHSSLARNRLIIHQRRNKSVFFSPDPLKTGCLVGVRLSLKVSLKPATLSEEEQVAIADSALKTHPPPHSSPTLPPSVLYLPWHPLLSKLSSSLTHLYFSITSYCTYLCIHRPQSHHCTTKRSRL